MNKKKICLIAQFPPPIHGLSKAVDTLYNSNLAEEYEFEKVDLTNNSNFLKNLRMISRSKADLFYFTISQTRGGNLRDLIILNLLEFRNKKCLVHLHGGYYRQLVDNDLPSWQNKMNYKAIRRLAGAIVLGESLRPIFEGMLEDSKVFIVPNCVDDEYLISDTEFNQKINTIDKRPIKSVLYMSNFIRTKGYPTVLGMAKAEKESCDSGREKKFHFEFAGKFFEDNDQDFFFNYIQQNNLEEYVTYHGIVDGNKKRELLKKCDIFALLTRYPNEGQPISILEAMGNGMIIVTTDHAGIPDVVKDGINGRVLKKDRENSYDLSTLIINPETMRLNREHVVNQYSQIQYISNLNSIFNIL